MANDRHSSGGTADVPSGLRRRGRRLWLFPLFAALGLLGLLHRPTTSTAQLPAGAYYGVFAGGEGALLDRVSAFEAQAGKNVAIIHLFTPWGSSANAFPTATLDAIRGHGSIPLVTWEPWSPAGGVNQPSYRLQQIISGAHDAYIRQWARDAAAWGHPFFLRFAHEMNGDWYPWSERVNGNEPGQYIKAWRKVHGIFQEEGAANVTWVWSVNKDYPGAADIAGVYPGDGYVDWVAIDAYNRGTASGGTGDQYGGTGWQTFSQLIEPTYDKLISIASGKPIMVSELGTVEDGGSKEDWFRKTLKYELKELFPRIEAVVYFNHVKTYDNRIVSSETARAAFAEGVGLSYYAANSFGNIAISPIPPLLFDAATADVMAPFVNVTGPRHGAVAGGQRLHITVDAEDRSGLDRVEIYINDTLQCTERLLPYECYWTVPRRGPRFTIVARAFDTVGHASSSSVVVTRS